MHVKNIGINLDHIGPWRKLDQLECQLDHFRMIGFKLIEIDITPFHLIINGQIHQPSLNAFLAVIRNFDLSYTVHGLLRLNLAYDSRHALCEQIMRSQIEICRAAGASRLVYHSGLQALDEVRYGVRQTLLSDDELAEGARYEVEAFRRLAPLAADAGVTIGMENGDTHRWEHEQMARFGLPREALSKHHARIHIMPIVCQLEAIDHPNVGLTVDVGHLYIAARDMGFDYLTAIKRAAPWLKHIHLSDNFGRLDWGFDQESDRWAFGEADVHMPPGWGEIPYREVFARWPDYHGDMIIELKPSFFDHAQGGLHVLQALL
ncbi:MAG: sugar phosphate isomerase/epimerase [Anaerolineae bacterium]|nr:sugar phosphate isomerase/epimerase [Anaerolineae bacterium]